MGQNPLKAFMSHVLKLPEVRGPCALALVGYGLDSAHCAADLWIERTARAGRGSRLDFRVD